MARRRKVSGELLALSATAVVGVYLAGYVITQPAAAALELVVPATTPPVAAHGYRDGTYLAEGRSRFGSVYVTVAISGGRISQVWINAVTTTFPPQVIAAMPGQVVDRQTASIDLVSGASASSAAFIEAVRAALAQALA